MARVSQIFNEIRFKREITSYLLYSINLCGIFPVKLQVTNVFAEYVWFVFATYSMLCFAGLGIIEVFINEYKSIVYLSVALNFLTSVVSFCNPLIFLISKKFVPPLLTLTDQGFYIYEEDEKFQVPEYSVRKLLHSQLIFAGTILVIYLGMTLLPIFLTLSLQNHENTVFDLLYVAWSPLGIKSRRQFTISFLMQWITTIPVYMAFISKTIFLNLFKREFQYQCDRLKEALRTICDRVPSNKKEILESIQKDAIILQFVKCDENEFLKKLAECEAHYQQIQKSISYFSSWFNLIFSCELTYGFMSFALIGYVLIQGTGNRGTDIKYFCLLGLFGGQLWYQCVISETIKSLVSKHLRPSMKESTLASLLQSCKQHLRVAVALQCARDHTNEDDIIMEVYNITWYDQGCKAKKSIQIFINHLQNRRSLRGFKIYSASIEIFAVIIRASYSYLSILNKMIHK